VSNVGLGLDVRLRDVLHVFVFCIHVVDVAGWVAVAVFSEVTYFSTVEARSFRAQSLITGLSLNICGIVVFWLGCVHVGVVALVLVSVVWGSGPRQVHWYLDIVVCGSRCVSGVVLQPLLLLLLLRPLLVLLGSSSPGAWPELVLVLPERVVEPSWIGDSSPGSDEFNHPPSFSYVDCSGLVLVVSLRDWELDDFI
jgi:hypothetical protein